MSAVATTLPGPRSLGRIVGGLAPVSLAVQVCSFASSVALARVLGAGTSTDAYYLGLSIPALTYGILMAALRLGAIPALMDALKASGRQGLERNGSELLTGVVFASAALTLLITGFVEALLPLVVGGRLLGQTRLAVLELAPYGVTGAVTGVLGSVLAVRSVFALPVAVMALEPIVKTVLTVTLGHAIGIQALIAGNLLGGALAATVLWWALRANGIRLYASRRFNTPFVRATALISIPLVVSQSVLQVNPVVDRTMASGFGAGSITALELGLRLFLVPAGLLTGLLIAPITATWAARKAAAGWPALQASTTRALDAAAVIVPPLVALGIVLRHTLVTIVFRGGAYPLHALHETAAVFGMILLALPAQLLVVVFSSLFIVQKDTIFPMKVAIANVLLNVALNFALGAVFGVAGIALSTSLTFTLLLVVYAVAARRRWGSFYLGRPWPAVARAAVSVAVMTLASLLLISGLPDGDSRPAALVVGATVGVVGLALHAVVLLIGRDPIALAAAGPVRRLALRVTR